VPLFVIMKAQEAVLSIEAADAADAEAQQGTLDASAALELATRKWRWVG